MRIAALLALMAAACGGGESDPTDPVGGGDVIGEGTIPPNVLEKAQLGDPKLRSAQRIAFGPGGVLLVADGARDRVVAIETGEGGFEVVPAPMPVGALRAAVAKLYGEEVAWDEILMQDVAVEPVSRRIYLAAERHHEGEVEPLVAFFDHEGSLRRLSTDSVLWAEIRLPPDDSPGSQIAEVIWANDRVIAVAAEGPFAPATLFVLEVPIRHGSYAFGAAPEVYLPVSGQTHLDLPLVAAAHYDGLLDRALLGGFLGAPVVRFPEASLSPGIAQGETVFDLGSGRELRAIVSARDGDRRWLWLSVYNGSFDGSIRGYRVGGALAEGAFGVDALAPEILDFTGTPSHPEVVVEPALDGAIRLATRTSGSVVVLEPDGLEVVSFE